MALNIGSVNFGIDANTAGLQKAIGMLSKFRQQINQVARSQTKAASNTAAVLSKQESAVKRNLQQFLNLRQAMERAKMPTARVQQLEKSFNRLTLELTSGRLSVVQYNRATTAFAKSMGEAGRDLKEFQKIAAGTATGKLAVILRNLESSAVLAIGPLSGVGARIRSLGAIAGRSSLAIVGLAAGVVALSVAMFKLSGSALQAGRIFESNMARFKAASGSLAIARKEMGFVIQTALQLGLRIDTSAKAFSRLAASAAGTSLEGKGARDVFLAVSKAAAALRLSGAEVEGTFRAIEQMMSKGSVQAEELRGQLGERLPGAFRIAAEAMGVTTRELGNMLKAGEVMADEFLPKLAAALEQTFGDAAEDNINSFQGSMNNLTNQTLLFGAEMNRITGITKITVSAIQKVAGAIEFLRKNLVNIVSVLGAVGVGLVVISHVAIWKGILAIGRAIKFAAIATLAWNAAILANPLGRLLTVVIKFGTAIIAATAAFFGFKFMLDDVNLSLDEMDTTLDALDGGINAAVTLSGEFKALADSVEDTVLEAEVLQNVLGSIEQHGVKNIDLLTKHFEIWLEVEKMTQKELDAMFATLLKFGSGPIINDIHGITDAIMAFFGRTVLLNEALEATAAKAGIFKDVGEQLEDLAARFKAIGQGTEVLEIFDEVDKVITAIRRSFEEWGPLTEKQIKLLAQLRAALLQDKIATDALTESEKAATKAKRDAITAQEKFEKGIISFTGKLDILRERNKALAQGPDSFEYFTKVEEKVMKARLQLEKFTDNQKLITSLTEQYRVILEEQLKLTDRFARANRQMAAAVVNGLEDIILKGASVTEMLHELANELLRVALRAMFLDKLQASLGAFFGGIGFPGGGGGGGSGGGGGGFRGARTFAHGGSFTIGGSGGNDRPVTFLGKPGEIVEVRRRDQPGGIGAGASVIINQTNNFEGGGLADPNVLIPLIEENNRRLKGEILDGLDRGTFR